VPAPEPACSFTRPPGASHCIVPKASPHGRWGSGGAWRRWNVIATNAVHAAITDADTICCMALREGSADVNHTAVVELLAGVGGRLSATLAGALSHKTQAAYESRDISARDAATCVCQATTLLDAARTRVLQA
jgi:hypothetical protein